MADNISNQSLTIILATTIPSVILIAVAVAFCCYRARRRRARLFNRGITPIDDEEIASWKVDRRASEKRSISNLPRDNYTRRPETYRAHRPSNSGGSIQKPPSVIIYQSHSQYNARLSEDNSMMPSTPRNHSMEQPQTPVLARAPNSRPGLTDDAVQGDDAFVSLPKRQPSRLAKTAPTTPLMLAPSVSAAKHGRSKSTRATMSPRDPWYGQSIEYELPRRSADTCHPILTAFHQASDSTHTTRSTPARESFGDEIFLGGLSPRPLVHKSEIGRAIG